MTVINSARDQAEAKFKKKEIQLADGRKAWVEYEAKALAVREKTARLRALRLARETARNLRQADHDEPPGRHRLGAAGENTRDMMPSTS